MHLDELALPVERLEIVRDRHQVRFRRQPVGRMAPVGVGERAELAALDERLEAIAHAGEVFRARQRPVRDRLAPATRSWPDRPTAPTRCRPSRARAGGRSGSTWSCTHCAAMIRLRSSRALGGGTAPIAFSTARIEAIACTVVHTPQMRWVKAQASRGSRPCRMISMPRNIVDDDHASRDRAALDFGLDAQVTLDAGDRIDNDAAHDVLLRLAAFGATWSRPLLPTRFMIWIRPWPANAAPTPSDRQRADRVDVGRRAEAGDAGQLLVERRHRVPEVRLGAADAGVAAADRPVGAFVPLDVRAVLRRRPVPCIPSCTGNSPARWPSSPHASTNCPASKCARRSQLS